MRLDQTQLQREITIGRLLISENQEKFEAENKPVLGLYDDFGLESFIHIKDWTTVDGIRGINQMIRNLEIRARYNSQRRSEVYIAWIDNEAFDVINNHLIMHDFMEAREVLLETAKFI